LIKWGGSVITDKSKLKTFRKGTVNRLSLEIKHANKKMIIIHGAGSFGHIKAKKHRLHEGHKNDSQLPAVSDVQKDVRELNLKVIDCMMNSGLRPISLPPSATIKCSNKVIKKIDADIFKHYIKLGCVPVTFGDVVLDEQLGFCICSGDQIMLELAKVFKPEKTIFVTNVDGVYTKNPTKKGAKLLNMINPNIKISSSGSEVIDVTDSITGKLKMMFEISKYSGETIILNGNIRGRLRDVIEGKEVVCTKIKVKN
jgi:isopentenyl phosphate kinase